MCFISSCTLQAMGGVLPGLLLLAGPKWSSAGTTRILVSAAGYQVLISTPSRVLKLCQNELLLLWLTQYRVSKAKWVDNTICLHIASSEFEQSGYIPEWWLYDDLGVCAVAYVTPVLVCTKNTKYFAQNWRKKLVISSYVLCAMRHHASYLCSVVGWALSDCCTELARYISTYPVLMQQH